MCVCLLTVANCCSSWGVASKGWRGTLNKQRSCYLLCPHADLRPPFWPNNSQNTDTSYQHQSVCVCVCVFELGLQLSPSWTHRNPFDSVNLRVSCTNRKLAISFLSWTKQNQHMTATTSIHVQNKGDTGRVVAQCNHSNSSVLKWRSCTVM